MTRLPKNRGITQAEEDKSLILRSFYSLRLNHSFLYSLIYLEPLPDAEFTSPDILRSFYSLRLNHSFLYSLIYLEPLPDAEFTSPDILRHPQILTYDLQVLPSLQIHRFRIAKSECLRLTITW